MQFRRGDVLVFEKFRKPKNILGSLFGSAISFFQKLDRNKDPEMVHTAICLDGSTCLEAAEVVKRGIIANYLKQNRPIHVCRLSFANYRKLVYHKKDVDAFIKKQMGKPYDIKQIGLFVINILSFGIYKPKKDRRLNVCSELVGNILQIATVLDENVNTSLLTPSNIYNLPIYLERKLANGK